MSVDEVALVESFLQNCISLFEVGVDIDTVECGDEEQLVLITTEGNESQLHAIVLAELAIVCDCLITASRVIIYICILL